MILEERRREAYIYKSQIFLNSFIGQVEILSKINYVSLALF
jgi:hypothetical protein